MCYYHSVAIELPGRGGVHVRASKMDDDKCGTRGENTAAWLSSPRFHAPLHNFTPPQWGAVTHCWTRPQHQMHFCTTFLILVLEIWFNFQIDVQCAEKAISNITFNIRWNLKQIWHSWHTSRCACILAPGVQFCSCWYIGSLMVLK